MLAEDTLPGHPERPSRSSAQRCPHDVLRLIFEDCELRLPDIAVAALVCRGWLETAQLRLYSNILFDSRKASSCSPAMSLRENSALRGYVRRIEISHRILCEEHPALYDWLRLLQDSNVQHLDVRQYVTDPVFEQVFVTWPLFLSVRSLALNAMAQRIMWPSYQCETLTLQAEKLSIVANKDDDPRFFRVHLPSLKKLLISSPESSPSIVALLAQTSATLEELSVKFFPGSRSWDPDLIRVLPLVTHLRRLNFQAPNREHIPFMDEVITRFTSLQHLRCSYGCYGPDLFSTLPSTVQTVTLESLLKRRATKERPSFLLARASLAAVERVKRGDLCLRQLILKSHDNELDLAKIKEEFRSAGITLMSIPWTYPYEDDPPPEAVLKANSR